MAATHPTSAEPASVRVATRLATALLIATAVFAVVLVCRGVVGAITGDHEVSFQGSVSVTADDTRMPAFVDKPGVAAVTVHVRQADAGQQLLSLVRDVTPLVLIGLGLLFLRRILTSVRKGEPFTQGNVRRLRGIGWLLIIGMPAVQIAHHYLDNALASTVPGLREWPNGGNVAVLDGPIAGLVVLVIAEVFAYGVRLREDVEGTI